MIERKYWAEGHCVEHSAQKNWVETSNSFRIWFRRRPLIPILVFLFLPAGINDVNQVAAKRELFGASFQMLGVDIFLPLCIRPLQRHGDQRHQMVHDHPPTFLWRQSRDE